MAQLFRPINLLIVAITQYLLQYLVLIPALSEVGLNPLLDNFHFFLLVSTTVLIATGGYVVNDIIDYKTDLVNKPEKVVVNNKLSKNTALLIYGIICIIGAIIAYYLAIYVNNRSLFFIYPVAVILLYLYSGWFKKMPLSGNIIVAIFCAGVAGIVLFAERETYSQLHSGRPALTANITEIFVGYIVFAFLSTLLREVVKDMEDVEGDKLSGLRTFPIVFGINKSKSLSSIISYLIFIGLLYSSYWLAVNSKFIALAFLIVGIFVPLTYLLNIIKKSKSKVDYSRLSKLTKAIMLSGLVLLILIWKF